MVVNDHFKGKVTCADNFPRNRSKLSHHIQLDENDIQTQLNKNISLL